MTTTYEFIADLLTEHMGVPEDIIKPDATFWDLELDSLTLVELTVIINDRLGIKLTEEDIRPTLGEFCQIVEERRNGGETVGTDTARQDVPTTPTLP
ncbi:acyl carrier protein [Streptomyces sp. GS7]|uniref:acyl carrier protein n=1 Tax=Streptomyces sp. GS7 TaxID=2692234 RepID=UPI001316B8B0|nr:acyl carrier protein [Streptomyces sp. GS7]QHC23795.1 acyl carrier protein [Streptomyces sp. GS7]